MERLIEVGQKLGLDGQELREFVLEHDKAERQERATQREAEIERTKYDTEQLRVKMQADKEKAEKEVEQFRIKMQKEKERTEKEAEQFRIKIQAEKEKAEKEAEQTKLETEQLRIKMQAEKERAEKEAEQNKLDFQLKQEQMQLDHEKDMEKMKKEHSMKAPNNMSFMDNMPTVPIFQDDKDDIDSYLERFERLATVQNWDKSTWAMLLSSLLTGKALDVYAQLPYDEATDYQNIKTALLKRYHHTEEGCRMKFRKMKPNENESPEQFVTSIGNYLEKWIEAAASTNYDKLKTLLIKEQFLSMCPQTWQYV